MKSIEAFYNTLKNKTGWLVLASALFLSACNNGGESGLQVSDEDAIDPTIAVKRSANDPVCKEVLDGWWEERLEDIAQDDISPWDTVCRNFDGDRDACVNRGGEERDKYVADGSITEFQKGHVGCAMLGAGSKKCVSNPCNHYNSGDCTLQKTGGLCMWRTKAQAKELGIGYGCYRNPCHIGGAGRTPTEECESRGIPGLVECTYCRISNKKMGCQATVLETEAGCAPINNKKVPKNTIWQMKKNKRCQCSTQNTQCIQDIEENPGAWKRRYPKAK